VVAWPEQGVVGHVDASSAPAKHSTFSGAMVIRAGDLGSQHRRAECLGIAQPLRVECGGVGRACQVEQLAHRHALRVGRGQMVTGGEFQCEK
jgi:hypothetical protein